MTSPRSIVDFIDLHREGNAFLGLALIDDKLNGESGVLFLATGFLLQATGYVLIAALSPSKAAGVGGTLGVVASLALAFMVTAIGARLWREGRRLKLIVEATHYDQVPRVRMALPIERRLVSFTAALGEQPVNEWAGERREELPNFYEGVRHRCRELFGIDDFFMGPDPYWKRRIFN
jgi:hypothetical protein